METMVVGKQTEGQSSSTIKDMAMRALASLGEKRFDTMADRCRRTLAPTAIRAVPLPWETRACAVPCRASPEDTPSTRRTRRP